MNKLSKRLDFNSSVSPHFLHMAIADYISGMTDRYAINIYKSTK
ncbi:hypothetical protein OAJ03_05075 [Candidatus Pelagibacter sp.]|nr:hypothetical protein [Candidatus Pelagibacter sp.]